MKNKYIFTLMLGLTACSSGSGGGGSEAPGGQSDSPGLSKEIRESLHGRYGHDPRAEKAAIQMANVFEDAVTKPEKALEIMPRHLKARACALSQDESINIKEIESEVINSRERAKAYLKYNVGLSGQVVDVPVADAKACE